jgi:hypothetical protein
MNIKRACLQIAALYRELAALDEQHRALYLAEAEIWETRADTEARLLIIFERKPLIQSQGNERRRMSIAGSVFNRKDRPERARRPIRGSHDA